MILQKQTLILSPTSSMCHIDGQTITENNQSDQYVESKEEKVICFSERSENCSHRWWYYSQSFGDRTPNEVISRYDVVPSSFHSLNFPRLSTHILADFFVLVPLCCLIPLKVCH
jgi:hypothetical protein